MCALFDFAKLKCLRRLRRKNICPLLTVGLFNKLFLGTTAQATKLSETVTYDPFTKLDLQQHNKFFIVT